MRTSRLAAALLAVAFLATACGGSTPASTSTPTPQESNPYGGLPVDPPRPNEVVLTVTGATTVDFTMGELTEMATRSETIFEPFVQANQTFEVVPVAELLADAGITPDQTVVTVALNDYRYADTAAALIDADALLAVGRDGAPIPMDQGGPIRLVFPDSSSYADFLDAWNWSLREIAVESPPEG